jgi:hypothetical protein
VFSFDTRLGTPTGLEAATFDARTGDVASAAGKARRQPGLAASSMRRKGHERENAKRLRMSIAPRDREALDLVSRRSFADAYVSSFDLEMQARRLTLGLYGRLLGGSATLLGTATFFGASELTLENEAGTFPESVRVESLAVSYDDEADLGRADLVGSAGWKLVWSFDGIAYTEYAAVVASLADDV